MSKLDELNKMRKASVLLAQQSAALRARHPIANSHSMYLNDRLCNAAQMRLEELIPYVNRAILLHLPELLNEAEELIAQDVEKATEAAREEALELLASTHKKTAPDAQ